MNKKKIIRTWCIIFFFSQKQPTDRPTFWWQEVVSVRVSMGIDSALREWLVSCFGHDGAVIKTTLSTTTSESKSYYHHYWPFASRGANLPHVIIMDHTRTIKFLREGCTNGRKFVQQQFLKDANMYHKLGSSLVYLCMDRGSPSNKSIEHRSRYAKKEAPFCGPARDDVSTPLNDFTAPKPGKEFESVCNDPQWAKRINYYITRRLVGNTGIIHPLVKEILDNGFHKENMALDYDDWIGNYEKNVLPDTKPYMEGLFDYAFPKDSTEANIANTKYDRNHYEKYQSGVSEPSTPAKTEDCKRKRDLEFIWPVQQNFAGDVMTPLDYKPAPGKTLCLHGGRLQYPSALQSGHFAYSEPYLLTFESIIHNNESVVRKVGFSSHHRTETINQLLEGEMAAVYYALNHLNSGDDVLITSGDGDLLLMLLMSSIDRIDPVTGVFKSRLFLCLEHQNNRTFIDLNQMWTNMRQSLRPCSALVGESNFSANADAYEFAAKLCAIGCLSGTDYVQNYCPGIKTRTQGLETETMARKVFTEEFIRKLRHDPAADIKMQPKKGDIGIVVGGGGGGNRTIKKTTTANNENSVLTVPIPWALYTFLNHYDEFQTMIKFKRKLSNNSIGLVSLPDLTFLPVDVTIDESKFIAFTQCIYLEKYKKPFGISDNVIGATDGDSRTKAVKTVRFGLYDKKLAKIDSDAVKSKWSLLQIQEKKNNVKKTRMQTKRTIRLKCRQLMWQLAYYYNGYRGDCRVPNALALYKELPYFGWCVNSEGLCTHAKRVSIPRIYVC